MKTIKLIMTTVALTVTVLTMGAQAPVAVDWHMGQNNTADGNYSSRFVIKNVSKQPLAADWQFFFNQFSRSVILPSGSPVNIEEVKNGYYRISPSLPVTRSWLRC